MKKTSTATKLRTQNAGLMEAGEEASPSSLKIMEV